MRHEPVVRTTRGRPPRDKTQGVGGDDRYPPCEQSPHPHPVPARAVSEELVETHLDLEGFGGERLVRGLVLRCDKGDGRIARGFVPRVEHVAQGDVLKPEVLPHVVVVGYVDARGDAGGPKREHLDVGGRGLTFENTFIF